MDSSSMAAAVGPGDFEPLLKSWNEDRDNDLMAAVLNQATQCDSADPS